MIYFSGLFTFFEKIACSGDSSSLTCDALSQHRSNFLNIDDLIGKDGYHIVSVAFSWSYCLLINELGEAILAGYLNGKSNQTLKLIPPDKGFIIQGACGIKNCHLVTRDGNYWLFDKTTHIWKNLIDILNAERGGELESERNVVIAQVACGNNINLAVDKTGSVYSVPCRLDVGVTGGVAVIEVACGKEHALLLTDHHTIYSWGTGSRGQLGHGSVDGEDEPRQVAALSGLQVCAVAAGGWHSCCLTDQRDLYAWGWNCSGQLGQGAPVTGGDTDIDSIKQEVVSVLAEPTVVDWPQLAATANVSHVSCGSRHTIALLDDLSVWGCGWNYYHQLSDQLPATVFAMSRLHVPLPPTVKLKKVVCGEWNSAFITDDDAGS